MRILLTILIQCSFIYLQAQHTFSIVAVDTLTGEIGSAGATCLTSADCNGCGGAVIISEIEPGLGAINAQASVCLPNVNATNGINSMLDGSNATQVLDQLLFSDACAFGDTTDRQYGIVTFRSNQINVAGYTGANTLSFAGHRTGDVYSIQGNILLDESVLIGMENNWAASEGENLADRLMSSLQGANIPGADSRCLADGISSKSSYIRVAKSEDPKDQLFLDIIVGSTNVGVDPIDSLQTLFDEFFLSSSTESVDEEYDFTIFPNPTNGKIKIEVPNEFRSNRTRLQAKFFDYKGRLLMQRELRNEQEEITFEKLSNQVLIYQIEGDHKVLKKGKLIIK